MRRSACAHKSGRCGGSRAMARLMLVGAAASLIMLGGCGEKLTANAYDDIKPGMTRSEIEQKLGPGDLQGREADRKAAASKPAAAVESTGMENQAATTPEPTSGEKQASAGGSIEIVPAASGASASASGPTANPDATGMPKPKWKIVPPPTKVHREIPPRTTVVWREGRKRIEVTFENDKAVGKLASGLE